ncbi:MAG TPA: cytochrome c peroxidase [Burkholderiales bacterium]|nr:cytochrome c peroxidase [Burkholderiales bacterium]
MRRLAAALAVLAPLVAGAAEIVELDPVEIRLVLRHGPWPQPVLRDPSNRVSGDARAIALGQRLFFDARLSANGAVACASCHVPTRAWTDGRPQAAGLGSLDRNTPTVLDAGLGRWFGWDGASDSLWSFATKPMLHPAEMGGSARHIAGVVRGERVYACLYEAAFRAPPGADDERVLVDAAKALAAYVETVRSGRTPFDEYRDALARGDRAAMARYPLPAQRGLKIFVGKGACSVCHFGPGFTNGEFHDIGLPFALGPGRVDAGRHEGVKRLRSDPLNLLGKHSDDASGAAATRTRHVESTHASFGQFKTPSLRNAALTAPYMHNGRLATLHDVARHYSELDMDRVHADGEALLRPLRLSERQIDDLVAFLESLTDPRAGEPPGTPAAIASCPD